MRERTEEMGMGFVEREMERDGDVNVGLFVCLKGGFEGDSSVTLYWEWRCCPIAINSD